MLPVFWKTALVFGKTALVFWETALVFWKTAFVFQLSKLSGIIRAREAIFGATRATLTPNLLVCKPLSVATALYLELLL